MIEIGSHSFQYLTGVDIIGLNRLERVVIGKYCFSQRSHTFTDRYNPRFVVKDCERLKELRIGRKSFCYYGICDIDNNASLGVIEMGKMGEDGGLFINGILKIMSTLYLGE